MKCRKCEGMILDEKEKGSLEKHSLQDMRVCACEGLMTIQKRLDRLGPELKKHCLWKKLSKN